MLLKARFSLLSQGSAFGQNSSDDRHSHHQIELYIVFAALVSQGTHQNRDLRYGITTLDPADPLCEESDAK